MLPFKKLQNRHFNQNLDTKMPLFGEDGHTTSLQDMIKAVKITSNCTLLYCGAMRLDKFTKSCQIWGPIGFRAYAMQAKNNNE